MFGIVVVILKTSGWRGTERAVWSWTSSEGGVRGVEGAIRKVITAALLHRLSFIRADKLLKELLTDCCWCAARKQPSVSVRDSATLLSCAKRGGRRATKRCSGGGSGRWQSWLPWRGRPEGRQCCVSRGLRRHHQRARTGGSDAAATRLLLVILWELSPSSLREWKRDPGALLHSQGGQRALVSISKATLVM